MIDYWDRFVNSLLNLNHFRNLIMFMMVWVISIKEYKSQHIDDKFMATVTFALGYYFGTE
tara:strand:- start:7509 stop:7688 length:180 start_codon:yes stop_codon:yes gene_type:complete